MKDINIGRIILKNRKVKGITQEELACYIGVSKASVSKWETNQSFPDITFLPQLASYFGISIDALMNYEPQMTKEDIRKLYLELSNDFYEKKFEETVAHCKKIIKKYYSCYPLLLQMGLLLFNNSGFADGEERALEIITEAKTLFKKVKSESSDIELTKQAFHMEALCDVTLQQPKEAIELLEKTDSFVMSSAPLLAMSYEMIEDKEKAKAILQVEIYQYLLTLLQLMQSYLPLAKEDATVLQEVAHRSLSIIQIFQLENLKPDMVIAMYLSLAQANMEIKDNKQAMEYLKKYTDIATSNIYPLTLKGDIFFTLLDPWFEGFAMGIHPPRDEKSVRESIYHAVVNNPIFASLKNNECFEDVANRLKKLYEGDKI